MQDQNASNKTTLRLSAFLRESLAIEGIHRDPTTDEINATAHFLNEPLTVDSTLTLQAVYEPGKPLRNREGMNVRIGRYMAPPGTAKMAEHLRRTLEKSDPHAAHVAFEMLHPFVDGNGRTGRAVWAWKMLRAEQDPFALSFLHRFYYQTLERTAVNAINDHDR